LEAFLAAQCQNIGQRCELANAVHLEQCLRLRILRLGELLDGTVGAATRRNSHRRRLGCGSRGQLKTASTSSGGSSPFSRQDHGKKLNLFCSPRVLDR
jgi:hypothetical protein